MNKKKSKLVFVGLLLVVGLFVFILLGAIYKVVNNKYTDTRSFMNDGIFSSNFIRRAHVVANNSNYLISPYSVEVALSMLRDGAAGDTRKELLDAVPERTINSVSVKKKVNVANALFVKDDYKGSVKKEFTSRLKNEFNAEVLYDKFETPEVINNWVNKETNGMIKNVVDDISDNFILGVANAVSLEEDWLIPFSCSNTKKALFTKVDGSKINVSMMNNDFEAGVKYYSDDEVEAVVIPYKMYDSKTGKEVSEDGEQLDFIAILPKNMDIYMESFDLGKPFNVYAGSREASDNLTVSVSIPRFEFEYKFEKFKDTLKDLGIKKVFSKKADLSGMLVDSEGAYVNQAVHKTYIKVFESGTKAAAVTFFGVDLNSMPMEEKEKVSIVFDKPFIYLIKDRNTNEILFLGAMYEPNEWDGNNSCE